MSHAGLDDQQAAPPALNERSNTEVCSCSCCVVAFAWQLNWHTHGNACFWYGLIVCWLNVQALLVLQLLMLLKLLTL